MAQYNYNKLKRPNMPVAIDDTALKNAGAAKTAAATELAGMNYNTFKQGDQYAGLKKSYETQGQRAMQDTLGQIAARTGGMASSYAGSAAQQSYNNYMQTLEDAARSMFNDEYSRAQDRYNMAANDYNTAYGEYRDKMSDAWNRYDAETRAYESDREFDRSENERITGEAKDNLYNEFYYGDGFATYEAYRNAGGMLDEATFNSIKASATGKRTDDGRESRDDELEAMLGAKDFNWDTYDWDGDGKIGEADTDGEGTPADFFGDSSYGEDYWRRYYEDSQAGYSDEDKAALNSEIEARIANGESIDDIATSLGIGAEPADGDSEPLTWKDVTGISEAEWKAFANDNAVKNYTYSNDEKGREAIMTALTDSASFSLSEKDQKNFDHIYGDGAYDTLQNGVNQLARELPMALIAWENEAHSNNTKTYDPEYFDRLLTDWYNEMGTLIPGITRNQLSDIINMHFPELADWADDANSAKPFIGKAFVDGRWITPAG
jgi:hypothetical protein